MYIDNDLELLYNILCANQSLTWHLLSLTVWIIVCPSAVANTFAMDIEFNKSSVSSMVAVTRNIGVELNIVFGKINCVSPNFIPLTDICIKTL